MLGNDYTDQFNQVVESVHWAIELPDDWENFFSERGECNAYSGDARQHRRMKARSYGVLVFEEPWKAVCRSDEPVGIYSKDFSLRGCGFVSPIQIYPEEVVRLVLSTLCLTLKVVRCRRLNAHCYDVGSILIRQSALSDEAFVGLGN